ncbi:putative MFS alpha-glucoside transporter [Thozetella sp. PMI_491]|nr:putative MFS alpha-glucoside transporter [Thozetella sp. PMI_491]
MATNKEIKITVDNAVDSTPQYLENVAKQDLEKPNDVVLDAFDRGQATTGFENWTLLETWTRFKKAVLICFACALIGANDGYQVGINASIIANKGFVQQFATALDGKGNPYLESPILSAWGAILSVGQVVGTLTIPFLSTHFGRKAAFYWILLLAAVSVMAESLSRTWQVWLVAKLICGIGIGSMQSTVPPYIAEIAPTRIRGALLMAYSFWWTTGSFFAQIALSTLNDKNPYQWLTPIYTQWSQVGVMLIIFTLIPESPVWCASQGKVTQAKKLLKQINGDIEGYDVDYQYSLVEMLIQHERKVAAEQRREKWYAIFQGTNARRTIIALWPATTQQFIGLKLFTTYGTYFFQQAGLPDPFLIKVITSSIKIAAVIGNILIADTIGRRMLAAWAATIACLCCIVVGILGVISSNQATNYVFVVVACLWMIGEISSQRLRPYTAGFAQGVSCVIGIIMDVLVPYMVNTNQWNWSFKTGWFYVGLGSIATAGMWFLLPETKGLSAAELDELFEKKVAAWRFAKTETATQRLVKAAN